MDNKKQEEHDALCASIRAKLANLNTNLATNRVLGGLMAVDSILTSILESQEYTLQSKN